MPYPGTTGALRRIAAPDRADAMVFRPPVPVDEFVLKFVRPH